MLQLAAERIDGMSANSFPLRVRTADTLFNHLRRKAFLRTDRFRKEFDGKMTTPGSTNMAAGSTSLCIPATPTQRGLISCD